MRFDGKPHTMIGTQEGADLWLVVDGGRVSLLFDSEPPREFGSYYAETFCSGTGNGVLLTDGYTLDAETYAAAQQFVISANATLPTQRQDVRRP